jgi:hypothetical protein
VLLVANFLQKAPLKSGPEQTESIPQNDGAKRGGKFDLLSAPE